MFKELIAKASARVSRALRSGAQAVALTAVAVIVTKAAAVKGVSDWSGITTAIIGISNVLGHTFLSAVWYSLFPPTK